MDTEALLRNAISTGNIGRALLILTRLTWSTEESEKLTAAIETMKLLQYLGLRDESHAAAKQALHILQADEHSDRAILQRTIIKGHMIWLCDTATLASNYQKEYLGLLDTLRSCDIAPDRLESLETFGSAQTAYVQFLEDPDSTWWDEYPHRRIARHDSTGLHLRMRLFDMEHSAGREVDEERLFDFVLRARGSHLAFRALGLWAEIKNSPAARSFLQEMVDHYNLGFLVGEVDWLHDGARFVEATHFGDLKLELEALRSSLPTALAKKLETAYSGRVGTTQFETGTTTNLVFLRQLPEAGAFSPPPVVIIVIFSEAIAAAQEILDIPTLVPDERLFVKICLLVENGDVNAVVKNLREQRVAWAIDTLEPGHLALATLKSKMRT